MKQRAGDNGFRDCVSINNSSAITVSGTVFLSIIPVKTCSSIDRERNQNVNASSGYWLLEQIMSHTGLEVKREDSCI